MTEYTGTVVCKAFANGSKSDHKAVMLDSQEGMLKLRRMGANPFRDDTLNELVGKTIICQGKVRDGHLFMDTWKVKNGD